MCAGNSISEALIEGICEIFERYVLKIIYTDKSCSLPKISEEYLKTTCFWDFIVHLQLLGYSVAVHDCSLGGKYPVVGLFMEYAGSTHFNLGSAPDFILALERCFTEIFQGKSVENFKDYFEKATDGIDLSRSFKKELLK
jgi:ribosomal protein S12 methylthiotransferase accessory factor